MRLFADTDIDTKIVAADGTTLLEYVGTSNKKWGDLSTNWNGNRRKRVVWGGMQFKFCVDGCKGNIDLVVSFALASCFFP